MLKIGLIVNPIAGIGGKVGLKGSDGMDTVWLARQRGAIEESGKKAEAALTKLRTLTEEYLIYTCSGSMGADCCERAKVPYVVCVNPKPDTKDGAEISTSAQDTVRAARKIREEQVDLLVFAGGDGTARNILDAVGNTIPVLGIPAGCKIHSGVYAVNPGRAGQLIVQFCKSKVRRTKEAEVMDIDEALFRQNIVEARLYGYLQVPDDVQYMQNLKGSLGLNAKASMELLAEEVKDLWEKDTLYIVGTGSTTDAIMKKMGLENTLLGVDLVWDGKVIAKDCTEEQILEALEQHPKAKILVTVIGGQGYIFGRGNQQISASVLRKVGKENIIIAATSEKMTALFGRPLYADTGDLQVNRMLSGYYAVIVGYKERVMAKVVTE